MTKKPESKMITMNFGGNFTRHKVIAGTYAGTEVTSSGILADVISIFNI